MLSLLPDSIHSTIKNVRDLLGRSTESESTPAQSESQSTPSGKSTRQHHDPATHAEDTTTASMNKSHAEVKSKIYRKLFEGTFEEGIQISDDEDEDVQEIYTTDSKTRRMPKKEYLTQTTRVTRIPINGQTATPLEQEQATEDLSFQFERSASIERRYSTRTRRDMPFGKSRKNFAPGLKPFDTLNSNNASSRSIHYNQKVSRGPEASTPTNKKARPLLIAERSPYDFHPSKRPRTKSPEPRRELRGHTGLRNRDTRSAVSPTSRANQDVLNGTESTITKSAPAAQVKPTPMRNISSQPTRTPDQSRHRSRSKPRPTSPDRLSGVVPDRHVERNEHNGAQFMRDAHIERQRRGSVTDSEQDHQSDAKFLIPAERLRSATTGAGPRASGRIDRTVRTPQPSKMLARLQESPDVLQVGPVTSVNTKRIFTSPSKSPPRTRPNGVMFDLKQFIFDSGLALENCAVEVCEKNFSIQYKDPKVLKDAISTYPISKIIRIYHPRTEDDTNVIRLSFSAGVIPGNSCFLDFGNSLKSYVEFVRFIEASDPKIVMYAKGREWFKNVLSKIKDKQELDSYSREEYMSRTDLKQAYHFEEPVKPRQRKVDQLDTAPLAEPQQRNARRVLAEIPTQGDPDIIHETIPNEAPLTRRARERIHYAEQPHESDNSALQPSAEPRRTGSPWKRPLTYPQSGKFRATVTWEDLERLEDDQFLNDNLIGMFMRYLQEHVDRELAKRMHFFSTFFYNSLTRPAEKGRARQINYGAVANWTKNIDIFSRNYVIVPVNESAHWYVMIICNLKTFKDRANENEDDDLVEIDNPAQDEVTQAANGSKLILESDLILKNVAHQEDSDYSDGLRDIEHLSAKRPLKKRKLRQPRQRKYDLSEPVIITLDSLGLNRSNTASALKDYIIAEAQEKHDLPIVKKDIEGMTAKNIPLQSNFSDCGLYLCMYLEQFVRDPAKFVESILQREEKLCRFPKQLEHGVLRQRFYDMLQNLHRNQVEKTPEKLPQLGTILIKEEDFGMYQPERVSAAVEYYEQNARVLDGHAEDAGRPRTGLEDALPKPYNPRPDRDMNGTTTVEDETILVEDSQEKETEGAQGKDGTSSRYFQQQQQRRIVDDELEASMDREDTPQTLANKLRQRRGSTPDKESKPSHTRARSVIDITSPVTSKTSPLKPQKSPNKRRERAVSCSTDHLTGNRIYQNIDKDNHESRPFVPEHGHDFDHAQQRHGKGYGHDDPNAMQDVVRKRVAGEDGSNEFDDIDIPVHSREVSGGSEAMHGAIDEDSEMLLD